MTFDFDVRSEAIDRLHAATAIFTAEAVVQKMLRQIGWPTPAGRLLDPSAGDGAFVVAALAQLPLAPDDLGEVARVHGWELHPQAVRAARDRVTELLMSRGWRARAAEDAAARTVTEGDFLTDAPDTGDFQVIAGNPPFLRKQFWPGFYQDHYARVLPAHAGADLLHAFLDRCATMLRDDGVMSFVTSDRWLFNLTARELRAKLGERVGLDHVERIDETTSFYRPKYRRVGTPPRIWPVQVVFRRAAIARFPLTSAAISPDEFGQPASSPAARTLADVASVRLAPWLGPNGIFVVNASTAAAFDGHPMLPAVDTDDLDPATDLLRSPTRFALLTQRDVEPEGVVREHLLARRHLMPKRKGNRPYWMPPETITLKVDRPALLVPRIARRLRAIRMPANVLPVNHNITVIGEDGGLPLEELARVLTCEASQEWIRRHAPRLEGGFLSITTGLLRRLPIE